MPQNAWSVRTRHKAKVRTRHRHAQGATHPCSTHVGTAVRCTSPTICLLANLIRCSQRALSMKLGNTTMRGDLRASRIIITTPQHSRMAQHRGSAVHGWLAGWRSIAIYTSSKIKGFTDCWVVCKMMRGMPACVCWHGKLSFEDVCWCSSLQLPASHLRDAPPMLAVNVLTCGKPNKQHPFSHAATSLPSRVTTAVHPCMLTILLTAALLHSNPP